MGMPCNEVHDCRVADERVVLEVDDECRFLGKTSGSSGAKVYFVDRTVDVEHVRTILITIEVI